jgi:hypothetical protein
MRVSGIITDAQGEPVSNVKVDLAADGIRFAAVYTDEQGHYSHTDSASYTGGALSLRAEKTGYASKELTRPIAADAVTVDLTMERVAAPPRNNRIAIIVGAALAVVAIGVVIWAVFLRPDGRPVDPPSAEEITFRLLVEDVFRIAGRGTVVTGTMQRGFVQEGDRIRITSPDNRVKHETVVTGVTRRQQVITRAGPGDQVGLLVRDVGRLPIESGDFVFGIGGSSP